VVGASPGRPPTLPKLAPAARWPIVNSATDRRPGQSRRRQRPRPFEMNAAILDNSPQIASLHYIAI
jgi:hypothetical protein